MKIKAAVCDESLGGREFDTKILEHCIEHFKNEQNIDLSKNQKAIRRLLTQIEKIKNDLSALSANDITVDNIENEVDFELELERGTFEELCEKEFRKC